tara:strand:+ start:481 stop:1227 length:747 start_codon:yes stop_codon:yes gene_type:complete
MKDIRFVAPDIYLKNFEDRPQLSNNFLPDWYKKLKHHPNRTTIKGCKPFADSMTTGYMLTTPQEFYLEITEIEEGKLEIHVKSSFQDFSNDPRFSEININSNMGHQIHPPRQFEGSPQLKKNFNFPGMKFHNPWKIYTPSGYSCLFTPPINRVDDRFEIISGIVDTDAYKEYINFPFILKKDYLLRQVKNGKYFSIIKKGTPYCQIIPFKRESWKMKIEEGEPTVSSSLLTEKFNYYSNKIWNRKSYK